MNAIAVSLSFVKRRRVNSLNVLFVANTLPNCLANSILSTIALSREKLSIVLFVFNAFANAKIPTLLNVLLLKTSSSSSSVVFVCNAFANCLAS